MLADKQALGISSSTKSSKSENVVQASEQGSHSSYSSSSVGITPPSTRGIGTGVSGRSRSSNRSVSTSCCSLCEVTNQRIYQAMVITLHLTALSELVYTGPAMDPFIVRRNKLLYKLRTVRDHCDHTLLHLASCSKTYSLGRYPVTKFPNIDVTKVLLKCGFDVNARDCEGKTPAHLTAESAKKAKVDSIAGVLNCLLAGGAHIDQADNDNNTALESLEPELKKKVNYFRYETLQCLAARVIAKNNINVDQSLPISLEQFVHVH